MHDPGLPSPWNGDTAADGKGALYDELRQALDGLLAGETDAIVIAANAVSAIYHSLPDVNWVVVYYLREHELVLGPFQGKPACSRIPLGQGVCGTAAARRRSVLVPDVMAFSGHIACDTASRAELVVPLLAGEHVLGVLDLDSPHTGRFDTADQAGCEALAGLIARRLALCH
ncbi:MAG: GAF domain-containing protein [Acetobacteraceae bacterium]